MSSDSVASFLDRARESRLLPPDQVEDLIRRPDVPHDSLTALCDFLQAAGALTPFQADRVRAGRGDDLAFAGYTITADLGPCPGGTAYRALHPSLRTPVVLRRVRPDWLAPADDPAAYIRRAQDASPVTHPHLAHLLDAGAYRDEPFVVLEPFDGEDLDTLVRDIGPMPTALACGFAREAALGLAAAHAHGLAHGDVRPANLRVGPLAASSSRTKSDGSPLHRPAPDATAKLFELGLVPARPGAAPPTPAGDVRDLGDTLYYLLAGKPPAGGDAPLKDARPDVPGDLAALVDGMRAADPAARPAAAAAADRLAPFAKPTPPESAPPADPATSDVLGEPVPLKPVETVAELTAAEPDPVPVSPSDPTPLPEPPNGWTVTAYTGPEQEGQPVFAVEAQPGVGVPADPLASDDNYKSPFAPSTTETRTVREKKPKKMTEDERGRLKMWFMIGAGFWVTAGLLWIVLINQAGCFGGAAKQSAAPKSYRK